MTTRDQLIEALDAAADAILKRTALRDVPLESKKQLSNQYGKLIAFQIKLGKTLIEEMPGEAADAIDQLKKITKEAKTRTKIISKTKKMLENLTETIKFLTAFVPGIG